MFSTDASIGSTLDLPTAPAGRRTVLCKDGRFTLLARDAGDFNGGGLDDIVVGLYGSDEVYVIYGRDGAFPGRIDLATLDATASVRIIDSAGGNELGLHISGAGDFNGDGYNDLVLDAHSAAVDGADEIGEAIMVFRWATSNEPLETLFSNSFRPDDGSDKDS